MKHSDNVSLSGLARNNRRLPAASNLYGGRGTVTTEPRPDSDANNGICAGIECRLAAPRGWLICREPSCSQCRQLVHPHVPAADLRLMQDGFLEPALIPPTIYDFLEIGPRRVWTTGPAALADRIEEKLLCLQMPVLLTRGERAPPANQPCLERMASLLPNRRTETLRRAPHALAFSAPQDVSHLTKAFCLEDKGSGPRSPAHVFCTSRCTSTNVNWALIGVSKIAYSLHKRFKTNEKSYMRSLGSM